MLTSSCKSLPSQKSPFSSLDRSNLSKAYRNSLQECSVRTQTDVMISAPSAAAVDCIRVRIS